MHLQVENEMLKTEKSQLDSRVEAQRAEVNRLKTDKADLQDDLRRKLRRIDVLKEELTWAKSVTLCFTESC